MLRFTPFRCTTCDWTLGNVPDGGYMIMTGGASFAQDTTLTCPQCHQPTVWFAPRPAKAQRARRKVVLLALEKIAA